MSRRDRRGFTLIEVLGALVLFSMGVLMTLNLAGTMGDQLDRAALRSEMVARARTTLDSLEAIGYAGLPLGSVSRDFTFGGVAYEETWTVSRYSPLLLEVAVEMEPESGSGPVHSLTSYVFGEW
jgi:prepilin-type N-terminal cleavage/methylation domain-containing protein